MQLTALCGALVFLVKLPTVLLLLPLAFLAWRKWRWGLLARPALWLLLLVALAPAVAYYYHAKVDIGREYFTVGVGFGGGMWFSPHDLLSPQAWSLMLDRMLKDHLTAVGLVLLPVGLLMWLPGRPRQAHLFQVWLVAVLVYFVVVSGGNLRQSYYQLPLLLPAAGLIGLGWERLVRTRAVNRWSQAALVVLFLALCGWGVQPMFEQYRPIQAAAAELSRLDPARQPVILFPPGYGALYYFDRPGWVGREGMGKPEGQVAPADVPGPLYISTRIGRGARWAVYFLGGGAGERPDLEQYLQVHFRLAAQSEGYEIFDLTAGARSG